MDCFKALIELARIQRVKDIVQCPADRGKTRLSVTENVLAGLHRRLAEIEGNLGSPAYK